MKIKMYFLLQMCLRGSRALFFTRLSRAAQAAFRKTRPLFFLAPLRRILKTALLLVPFSQADPYACSSQQSPPCVHAHTHTHTCTHVRSDFCPFKRLTVGKAVLLPYGRTDKAFVQIFARTRSRARAPVQAHVCIFLLVAATNA